MQYKANWWLIAPFFLVGLLLPWRWTGVAGALVLTVYVACYPLKWQRLQNAAYDMAWPLLTGMSFHLAVMLHLRVKNSDIGAAVVLCASWVVLWFGFMCMLKFLETFYGLKASPAPAYSFTPRPERSQAQANNGATD